MRLRSDKEAISTIILIILLLFSLIVGALLSYLWVMASFYNVPEDKTLLLVEEVIFPAANAEYFNVTILNPSNSAHDANITTIHLIIKESGETYNITTADPPLPFWLHRGRRQTLRCERNWSPLAGETVRIEPIAANTSTVSSDVSVPETELLVTATFDPSQTVQYFNVSATNSPQSEVNLTISEVFVFGMSMENVTPPLPLADPLSPGNTETLQCKWDWKGMGGLSVNITVKTLEGFESTYTTEQLSASIFHIENISYNYSDTKYFNVTFNSSEESTAIATLESIDLTLQDGIVVQINDTDPQLGFPILSYLLTNQSRTFKCFWDWGEYRNKTITVSAFTMEGMTVHNKTVTTPPDVVWNITDINFDLDTLGNFSVKIKNTLSSLQNITVTEVELNEETLNFTVLIPIGEETEIICPIDWTALRGQNVSLRVHAGDVLLRNLTLPSVSLEIVEAHFGTDGEGKNYNLTIQNNVNSLRNLTISNVTLTFQDDVIYQTQGVNIIVAVGENKTLTFSWDWSLYESVIVAVTIQTDEGFSETSTFIVQE